MELVAQEVGQRAEAFESDLKKRYAIDGFVVVRSLFDTRTVKAMAMVTDGLRAAPDSIEGAWKYYDDNAKDRYGAPLIHRVERFRDAAPVFGRVLEDPAVTRLVTLLLGARGILFKEKINFKPAGGSGFLPHQDMQADWGRYASVFVSAFVAIDETTIENGCLEVVAGAHNRGLLGPTWAPLEADVVDHLTFVPIEMQAGDVIFFDGLTPHRSGVNRSPYDRRVLCATYNRKDEGDQYERYFADKFAALPPNVARRADVNYRYRV